MSEIADYWMRLFQSNGEEADWWLRKKQRCKERNAEIVKVRGKGVVTGRQNYDQHRRTCYRLHLTFLMKQHDFFYTEEQVLPYEITFPSDKQISHQPLFKKEPDNSGDALPVFKPANHHQVKRQKEYNRLEAVRYAERWWNSYNPAYHRFEDDCTNYISQCLRAGGGIMWGEPVRERGWWYEGSSWSFSWAVAHSMRWYLSGSDRGIQGIELERPEDLIPGDVICYDFNGDGNWNHTTIVVAKDTENMPLVNAHTDNSRNRYWSYEDSSAWTPEIQYKFFRIAIQ